MFIDTPSIPSTIGVGRQERHQLKVRTVKEELPMEIKKTKRF
jgi:hypothetical protein